MISLLTGLAHWLRPSSPGRIKHGYNTKLHRLVRLQFWCSMSMESLLRRLWIYELLTQNMQCVGWFYGMTTIVWLFHAEVNLILMVQVTRKILNSFKYRFLIQIICSQLHGLKYSCLKQIIFKEMYLTHKCDSNRNDHYGSKWNWE